MTAVVVTPAAPAGALEHFDAWLGRRVSMRTLALLRVLVGPVVLLHLWPFLTEARHGSIYRDHFHQPYAAWYPELPRDLYVALLWTGAVAAVAMSIGLATRRATVTTFAVVTYYLFLSTTQYHNNRAYLVIVLAALALAPGGRELSIDAWWRTRSRRAPLDRTSPAWPLGLLRFEAATVYGASGLSKLLDRDWFAGTVAWHRLVLVRDRLDASPLPRWAVRLLTDRTFHAVSAKVIIATELFIALGLGWRATRLAAVWVAVCFHVSIQLSASVEVFSYLAVAVLVIWAVPSTREPRTDDRPDERPPTEVCRRRAGARLARPIPHLRRPTRIGATDGGPRWCRAQRPCCRGVRLEPVAVSAGSGNDQTTGGELRFRHGAE